MLKVSRILTAYGYDDYDDGPDYSDYIPDGPDMSAYVEPKKADYAQISAVLAKLQAAGLLTDATFSCEGVNSGYLEMYYTTGSPESSDWVSLDLPYGCDGTWTYEDGIEDFTIEWPFAWPAGSDAIRLPLEALITKRAEDNPAEGVTSYQQDEWDDFRRDHAPGRI